VKLFVGNLSFDVKDDDLRTSFGSFGRVDSAAIIKERMTAESRGFGFVEMPSRDEAQAAIVGMNGKEFMGRMINVNEARPMPERERSGGGGSSRGGFSSHRPGSSQRDGNKRKSGSQKGRKSRFEKRSY